jgi:hypothetical protein
LPVFAQSWLVLAPQDGGDVLSGHALQVQVDLLRALDRQALKINPGSRD